MQNLLSIITFIPAIAAAILALIMRGDDEHARRNAKWVALVATSLVFVLSIFLYTGFDPANTGFQFVEESEWLLGLTYNCLLYTSPSPRDRTRSRMPSSA